MNDASGAKAPNYGIDAPPVIRNLALGALAGFGAAVVVPLLAIPPAAATSIAISGAIVGFMCLADALGMLWYSRVRKIRARQAFLDLIPWRGDETVLDVGCGRGLLLVEAARRLKSGRAVGIDLWQDKDLSDNRPEATLENARLEGVANRVEVKSGDARELPFPDASFDVVVSGLALHNIYGSAERAKAVREIARVLKPGGRVALTDIQYTRPYADVLQECGLADVKRFRSSAWTPVVIAFTWGAVRPYRVTARKLA